jgi:hypothetical protein
VFCGLRLGRLMVVNKTAIEPPPAEEISQP